MTELSYNMILDSLKRRYRDNMYLTSEINQALYEFQLEVRRIKVPAILKGTDERVAYQDNFSSSQEQA